MSARGPAGKSFVGDAFCQVQKFLIGMRHQHEVACAITNHTHFMFVAESQRPSCPYCKNFQNSGRKNLMAAHRCASQLLAKKSRHASLQSEERGLVPAQFPRRTRQRCVRNMDRIFRYADRRAAHTWDRVKPGTGGLKSNTAANKCASEYMQNTSAIASVERKRLDHHRQSANMSSSFSPH